MAEDYFGWLYGLTGESSTRSTSKTHMSLCRQMHMKPFRWYVRNDDNRNADAKDLRLEFLDEFRIRDEDDRWLNLDASVLEVLIALSRRLAFESYSSAEEWFWKMIENLGLQHYSDAIYRRETGEREVEEVLERLLERTYGRDGTGGLFPLRRPHSDQRRVEIWYQKEAYLLEGNDVANGP